MKFKKTAATFIDELINAFPEIKDEVLDEDYLGVISLQVGCFRRFTQRAIDNSDLITLGKCIEFVDNDLDEVEFSVENSLVISYLGKLHFSNNPQAENLLSRKLKSARKQLKEYYDSASKDEKLNEFLKNLEGDDL